MLEKSNRISLREKVEKVYYNYGKFAASRPILMLTGVITVILISWYPLPNAFILNISPYEQRKIKLDDFESFNENNEKFIGYVQQIVVENSASFDKIISNYPIEFVYSALSECFTTVKLIKTQNEFDSSCYKTGFIKGNKSEYSFFPQESCLVLSPVQMWHEAEDKFWADGNILDRINRQSQFIKEITFGLPWKKTGIRDLSKRNRHYKIYFVITFVLKEYNKKLLRDMYDTLSQRYNVSEAHPIDTAEEIVYIDRTYISSHMTLLMTYLILILYVYFSVRKIEMVKSKIGLAFSACFTVAASLYMSLGICLYIGIIVPTLPGSEIFPYLVIIIGLENTLVITKSVVATPVDLPVKHRIAQGLEKEGWAITKNLVSEILIFSLGIFTFNPAIQEFFLLALIGLSVDFFLQITFFVTVLSIDMRRIELSDVRDNQHGRSKSINRRWITTQHQYNSTITTDHFYSSILQSVINFLCAIKSMVVTETSSPPIYVTPTTNINKSHKRKSSDINIAAFIQSDGVVPVYIPRRLLFLYIWAKSRIFQKLVMIIATFWIFVLLIYSINKVNHRSESPLLDPFSAPSSQLPYVTTSNHFSNSDWSGTTDTQPTSPITIAQLNSQWKLMAINHWPKLAQLYSINITSHKLIILPPWQLTRIHVTKPAQPSSHSDTQQPSPLLHNNKHQPQSNKHSFSWLSDSTNDLFSQIPSTLRDWADASLTFKMLIASVIGVGLVLMLTVLVLSILQTIQAVNGDNREPILRILPLVIHAEFSCPPGIISFAAESIILAAGLSIISPSKVHFLLRSWSIETGCIYCKDVERRGIWKILFVSNELILISYKSGRLELWHNYLHNTSAQLNMIDSVDVATQCSGGIVQMIAVTQRTVLAATISGWLICLDVNGQDSHHLQIRTSNQIFTNGTSSPIKDMFSVSTTSICVYTHNSICLLDWTTGFTVIYQANIDQYSILACYIFQDYLVVSLTNNHLYLVMTNPETDLTGVPINIITQYRCKWSTTAPVHWLRIATPQWQHGNIDNTNRIASSYSSCGVNWWCSNFNQRAHCIMLASYDLNGTICIWKENIKYPIRQIVISQPDISYPGPVCYINNEIQPFTSAQQHLIVFADQGYLRLFNIRLNKYVRSIQILAWQQAQSPSDHCYITSISIAANKWIVCLTNTGVIYVLPISTIQ